MKIILCSAKDPVRERWRSILQGHDHSLYQASSPELLRPIIQGDEKFLLLMHQPFMELQSLANLCRMKGVCGVFILSDTPSKEDGIALLQRGVAGYANTYISAGRLLEAVKTVGSGRVWFSQEVLARFIQTVSAAGKGEGDQAERVLEPLSEREREIALLIARGMSNQEIGEKLFISERTVKSHLGAIFEKTGMSSRLKLALMIHGHL